MEEELEKYALKDAQQVNSDSIDGVLENYAFKEAQCIEQVKSETIWDVELEGSQTNLKLNEKCGEIMLDSNRDLILVCVLCENQFRSLRSFGKHISSCYTSPAPHGNQPFEFLSVSDRFLEAQQDSVLPLYDKSRREVIPERNNLESIPFGHNNNRYANNIDQDYNEMQSEENSSIVPENASKSYEIEVGEEIFECYVCSEAFSYDLYQAHLKAHVESNSNRKTKLQNEMEETVIRSMYPCTKCSNVYRQKRSLIAHIKLVHENGANINTHQCPHCPKQFTASTNLRVHIYSHLNIKKYSCKYCGKSFVQSTCRNLHEKRHTGEKLFQCEYCGLRFLLHTKLTSHIKRHLNIRDFKCDVCGKTFFLKQSLKNHMYVHSVSRPFKCDQCERSFPSQRYLIRHRQVHSLVKKYVCKVCGKAFAQAAGLCTHRKSHRELP